MKTIRYNEYGAPIDKNPTWCNVIGWVLNRIGKLFYPRYFNLAIWFWSWAYAWNDVQLMPRIKGFKALPTGGK
jgi:hypothetical protein